MSLLRNRFPLAWTYHRNTALPSATTPTAPIVPPAGSAGPEDGTLPWVRLLAELPETTLAEALRLRASTRTFAPQPLALGHLGAVLDAGFGGVTDSGGFRRFAPSAGGLHPLQAFVLVRDVTDLDPGLHHYAVGGLERVFARRLSATLLTWLFVDQPFAAAAAAVVVTVAAPEATLGKYGDRGYRHALLEAGHVAQNMNLAAAAMGVGCCNLGGFRDRELSQLLDLDGEDHFPVYALALGVPSWTW
jgi:SagB-type dehydrogenase family enzyme